MENINIFFNILNQFFILTLQNFNMSYRSTISSMYLYMIETYNNKMLDITSCDFCLCYTHRDETRTSPATQAVKKSSNSQDSISYKIFTSNYHKNIIFINCISKK